MVEKGWAYYRDIPVDEGFGYGTKFDISETFGSENMVASAIQFDPGDEGPMNYHHEPIEEYYVVLDGKLEIQLDDEVIEAEAGSVLFLPAGTRHAPRNPYDEPAVLLAIISPGLSIPEHSTDAEVPEVSRRHHIGPTSGENE